MPGAGFLPAIWENRAVALAARINNLAKYVRRAGVNTSPVVGFPRLPPPVQYLAVARGNNNIGYRRVNGI